MADEPTQQPPTQPTEPPEEKPTELTQPPETPEPEIKLVDIEEKIQYKPIQMI